MNANDRLSDYFTSLEHGDEFSGVVLITKGDLELFHGCYGYASRQWKMKNTLDTRFDTASITKLFTAVATLQLIEQGLLALDTGIIDLLKLKNTTISRDVNVYHLLTHTSGIGDDVEEEDGEIYADLWKSRPNYAVTTTVDFLPQFVHKPPNFPPGQGCRYCNCSFILLGLAIEKLTGMTYREYVRQHIFYKAEMRHSDFFHLENVNENVAEGSDPVKDTSGKILGWRKNIYSYPPVGSPDSGAHVTVGDLNRFLRSVQTGKLLSKDLTEKFLTPQVQYRETEKWIIKYGMGLMFYLDKTNKVVCYQKDGINAGVSGIIRHFPDRDLTIMLLSNMDSGVWKPVWEIHNLVIDGLFD
ncbi:MAG: serine hydrolase domain-containing protein [Candidatus Promineifilaceae bacterium]|nr:serine hydrolase domain-containing protein [Candidatus Promineifilaceae bacterium]